jgi:hypothetical protein
MADIDGLWHATAMTSDYDGLLGPMQRLFGAVVMHDTVSDHPAIGRRGGMIWIGDNSIEIGAPVGDVSPVRGFVERWGGGMHSIAVHVPDLAATLARLDALGVAVIAKLPDQDIVFTRPADTAGLLLEWSATNTPDDPRWGYPLRHRTAPPLVDVLQYAFVTAMVDDPVAVGRRLADLFGTELVREVADCPSGGIGAIVSLVDCLLVCVRLPPGGATRAEWGQDISRPRFHGHGLRVGNVAAARSLLAGGSIAVRPAFEGCVMVDPDAVPFPTYLCEALLPEDPRRSAAVST